MLLANNNASGISRFQTIKSVFTRRVLFGFENQCGRNQSRIKLLKRDYDWERQNFGGKDFDGKIFEQSTLSSFILSY